MDNDFTDYRDPQGFATRDYTMDASDVARLRSGTDISGAVKDPTLYPLDSYINNPAAPTTYNMQRRAGYGTGPLLLQRPNVTSQQPSVASMGIPGFPLSGSGTPGTMAGAPMAMPISQADAFSAVDAARGAVALAQTPMDYSSPTALATSQRTRVAQVPGGTDFFDHLSTDGGPVVTSQDGTISSDIKGSPKGAAGMATNVVNDPRFRTIMALNPGNGRRLYSALTGRDYDTDQAATTALLATQNENQLKLGSDVAKTAMRATKDDNTLGIKAGDIVKQVIQPGLLPGTVAVGQAPLTDLEAKGYGITKDQNGNQVGFIPGSLAHKAFGMSTIGDDANKAVTDRARQAFLHNKAGAGTAGSDPLAGYSSDTRLRMTTAGVQQKTADQQSLEDTDAGMAGVVNSFGDAAISTLRGMQNFGSGLQNIGNKVINYFGGSKNSLGTPTFTPNNDAYLNQGTPVSPVDAANASRLSALRAAGYDI